MYYRHFVSRAVLATVALLLLCYVSPAIAASGGEHEDLAHGNAGAQLEDASEFKTDLAIYTIVVFLLLLAVLSKFAWPVISAALVEREKRIEDHIVAAESKHEEAKRLLAEHEAKLATAADQVRALLDEARRDAEHTKNSIVEDAKKVADAERERAVRDIERAADHAMKGLAETSANLAVDLAEKVVRQTITPEQQSALVREALDKLGVTQPSEN